MSRWTVVYHINLRVVYLSTLREDERIDQVKVQPNQI